MTITKIITANYLESLKKTFIRLNNCICRSGQTFFEIEFTTQLLEKRKMKAAARDLRTVNGKHFMFCWVTNSESQKSTIIVREPQGEVYDPTNYIYHECEVEIINLCPDPENDFYTIPSKPIQKTY